MTVYQCDCPDRPTGYCQEHLTKCGTKANLFCKTVGCRHLISIDVNPSESYRCHKTEYDESCDDCVFSDNCIMEVRQK